MDRMIKLVLVMLLFAVATHVQAVDGIAIKSTYPNYEALAYGGSDILNNNIVRLNIVDSKVSGAPVLLTTNAGRERMSPNGQKVAFLKYGNATTSKLCVMSINGGTITELCDVPTQIGIDFPTNDYIYFNGDKPEESCPVLGGERGGDVYRISATGGTKELMVTLYPEEDTNRVARTTGYIDVSSNESRICFHSPNTLRGITCNGTTTYPPKPYGGYVVFDMANKLSSGKGILMINNGVACDSCTNGQGKADNSCGGGMSWDGRYVLDGWTSHSGYDIRDANNMGTLVASVSCGNEHQPGQSGGACNNADWITRTIGDGWGDSIRGYELQQSLFNWRTGEQIVTGRGDGGDFWVGSASTNPTMLLSPGTLTFTIEKGAANPAAQNVAVSNSGAGTLNTVTTAIAYGTGVPTGWLAVTAGGATNSQTLANTVTLETRDTGTYTATVTITCANTSPTTSTYTVTMRVNPVAVAVGSLVVSPAICTTYTRSSFLFLASAKDGSGNALNPQPVITWAISGSQTIGTNGNFTSGSDAGGPYTVTATAGTKTATATVRVVRPITITVPAAAQACNVGNTLTITWTKPTTVLTGGLLVSFSANGGQAWHQISGETFDGVTIDNALILDGSAFYTATTGRFKWIIPTLTGDNGDVNTVSSTCKIKFYDPYATIAHRKTEDQSAVFTIGSNAPVGTFAIPGTIEAEAYTNGFDTTGVSLYLEACNDVGGGLSIGYINNNYWVEYPVTVATAGVYTVSYRAATPKTGSTIELRCGTSSLATAAVLATTAIDSTGGYNIWKSATSTVTLAAGAQTLRLTFKGQDGVCNLNNIVFTGSSGTVLRLAAHQSSISNGSLTVYSLSGKLVGTFNGLRTGALMNNTLKSGVYIVHAKVNGVEIVRSMVINK